MKIIIIITILFLTNFCETQMKKEVISKDDIRCALQVVLDSVVVGKIKTDFELSSRFSSALNDSVLYHDLFDVDAVLNKENLLSMVSQYNQLKDAKIDLYVPLKYKTVLVNDYTGHNNLRYFELSPPLFSKDKASFVLYVLSIFDVNGNPKWDDLYFVFKIKEGKWKLNGVIKRRKP